MGYGSHDNNNPIERLWSTSAKYMFNVVSRNNEEIVFSLVSEQSFNTPGYLGVIGNPETQEVIYENNTRPIP